MINKAEQKETIERIEELYASLHDRKRKEYRSIMVAKFCGKKSSKVKVNTDCKIISSLLLEDGYKDISEMTVYRLLKIREKDIDLYKSVKNGELKIKQAYNILCPPPVKDKEVEPKKEKVQLEEGEPDFNELLELMSGKANQLEEWQYKLSKEPNLKTIREIDNELYRMRKSLGKIVSKYDESR